MAELTKEYFDQIVKGLPTKEDLKGFATKGDLRAFATKDDLKTLASKRDLEEQTDAIGRMISVAFQTHQEKYLEERFERLSAQLSLATELHTLRNDFAALRQDVDALKRGKLRPSGPVAA